MGNAFRQKAQDRAEDQARQDPASISAALSRLGGTFETLPDFLVICRLLRLVLQRQYSLQPRTLTILGGAIIYVVTPCDALPDVIPCIGMIDDAAVVFAAVRACKLEIEAFKQWEQKQSSRSSSHVD